jgi:hypothetical protein
VVGLVTFVIVWCIHPPPLFSATVQGKTAATDDVATVIAVLKPL